MNVNLAQTTDVAKAAGDMIAARDVVPFQSALILLLLAAVIYLYRAREKDQAKFVNFLLGTKGDTDGDGKPG